MAKRKKPKWDGTERRAPAMVLIAGDDLNTNELLVRILAARGFRTVAATSHDTAVARAMEQLPRAAVMDLSGGIGANLHLLDWFRSNDDERLRRCRVVVIAKSTANRTFSFQSGADDFLQRPFHANDLVDALEDVLATPSEDLAMRRRELINRADAPA